MKIKLLHLDLNYFKGIKKYSTDFTDNTMICGENATGKTTLVDAFTWLLFGKDSTGRSDSNFQIKTLDENGKVIPQIEHEVSATLDVDGSHVKLRRVYKEKWVKKRGEETSEFTGHTTDFFVDDVPMNLKDYQAKVAGIIDEEVFKMITSVTFFNTLHWEQRRNMLTSMVQGKVNNEEIISGNQKFKDLLDKIGSKSLKDYKAQLSAERKQLKEKLEAIPTRIDEITRNMPEPVNEAKIGAEIDKITAEIEKIDKMLLDSSEKQKSINEQKQKKLDEIYKLKAELRELEETWKEREARKTRETDNLISEKQEDVEKYERKLSSTDNEIFNLTEEVNSINKKMDALREKWNQENQKTLTFNEDEFSCPACKRPFEADDIKAKKDEMLSNFNEAKSNRLQEINNEGVSLGEAKETKKVEIEKLKSSLKGIELSLNDAKKELIKARNSKSEQKPFTPESIPGYKEMRERIETFEPESAGPEHGPEDNQDLIHDKRQKLMVLDSLKSKLAVKDVIAQNKSRIEELNGQEKSMAQQLANLEKDLFTIEELNKAKVELIEEKVNSLFKYVSFRMFKQQINGGFEPTCEVLVNNIPFSDANNAGKINAGIDIINTLSDHYKVTAPIWIDNRESVNKLIESDSQIINLVVTQDPELVVKSITKKEEAII